MNLTKDVHGLYTENENALLWETEDQNRQNDKLYWWIIKPDIAKISFLYKLTCRFDVTSI